MCLVGRGLPAAVCSAGAGRTRTARTAGPWVAAVLALGQRGWDGQLLVDELSQFMANEWLVNG